MRFSLTKAKCRNRQKRDVVYTNMWLVSASFFLINLSFEQILLMYLPGFFLWLLLLLLLLLPRLQRNNLTSSITHSLKWFTSFSAKQIIKRNAIHYHILGRTHTRVHSDTDAHAHSHTYFHSHSTLIQTVYNFRNANFSASSSRSYKICLFYSPRALSSKRVYVYTMISSWIGCSQCVKKK